MAIAAKRRFRRYRQLGVFDTGVTIILFDFTFQLDTISRPTPQIKRLRVSVKELIYIRHGYSFIIYLAWLPK
jgi:hypothetical protein